jgi:hypothetical protein
MRVSQEKVLSLAKSFFMWLSAPSRFMWRIGPGGIVPDQRIKDRAMSQLKLVFPQRPLLYKFAKTRNMLYRFIVVPFWAVVSYFLWLISLGWPIYLGEIWRWILNWISDH